MEYLFAQTRKVMPSVAVDIDFTEVELSEVEEEDEGIEDILHDMTLSILSQETMVAPATDAHEAVDANVSGLGAIDTLVECLVGLRKARVLSNQQALEIIRLWNNLDPNNRQPSLFTQRSTARKDAGRFWRSKGAAANSNAESVHR